MVQSRFHAVDARRLQERRSWVVSFSISRPFGPRRETQRPGARRVLGAGPQWLVQRAWLPRRGRSDARSTRYCSDAAQPLARGAKLERASAGKILASQQGSSGGPIPRGAEPSERWGRRIERRRQPSPARLRSRSKLERPCAFDRSAGEGSCAARPRRDAAIAATIARKSRRVRAKASKTRREAVKSSCSRIAARLRIEERLRV